MYKTNTSSSQCPLNLVNLSEREGKQKIKVYATLQCSRTNNAGVCGKDCNCSCSTGLIALQQECVKSKLHVSNITYQCFWKLYVSLV